MTRVVHGAETRSPPSDGGADGYLSATDAMEVAQQLDYLASLVAADMAPAGAPAVPAAELREWSGAMRRLAADASAAKREGKPGVPYRNADFFELGVDPTELRALVEGDQRLGERAELDVWDEPAPTFLNQTPVEDARFEFSPVGVRTPRQT